MTIDKWAVLSAGVAAIVALNWHFLRMMRRPIAAPAAVPADLDGVQQVAIVVDGGYAPDTIRVRAGAPVRLVFDRRETNSCSEELVIAALGVRRYLAAHEQTPKAERGRGEQQVDRPGEREEDDRAEQTDERGCPERVRVAAAAVGSRKYSSTPAPIQKRRIV